jgi:hypothetical protein
LNARRLFDTSSRDRIPAPWELIRPYLRSVKPTSRAGSSPAVRHYRHSCDDFLPGSFLRARPDALIIVSRSRLSAASRSSRLRPIFRSNNPQKSARWIWAANSDQWRL